MQQQYIIMCIEVKDVDQPHFASLRSRLSYFNEVGFENLKAELAGWLACCLCMNIAQVLEFEFSKLTSGVSTWSEEEATLR